MFEYDASLALRVEIVETALTAVFETIPKGHAARFRLIELLDQKVKDAAFARTRRHGLERCIAHISQKLALQDPQSGGA
ncbi:hypothetical protein OPKNFCMD_4046 [Methylobacterium crusticola]|uniref:Uncharacterized protein n=1 Tax=Methylobacterium crusticola TaxID=1697972 RepID=A0ABQ4R3G6_9HYPH|nr:hypothetical protein [Methylobacterium crusticola]GJD51292.1 hypothetical protein OPKNFCMD_4046 [Methylobacterium crusticola]